MIKTQTLSKLAVFALGVLSLTQAQAANRAERVVGAGLGFASPEFALETNPAALGDITSTSISGQYFTSEGAYRPSARVFFGSLVLGANYFEDPGTSRSGSFGAAVSAGRASLGLSAKGLASGGPASLDLGFNYAIQLLRFTIVARNLESQVTEIDFGVSGMSGPVILFADIKKPTPLLSGDWLIDVGGGLVFDRVELSAGLAWNRAAGSSSGTIHTDIAVKLGTRFALEAFYNPILQETSLGTLGLGLKVTL
jgi:hypothetical protein